MLPEYNENEFDEQQLDCSNCHWKGKGFEAIIIDFFGVVKTKEVHCPNCDATIGIVTKDNGKTTGESANGFSFQTG